MSWHPLDLETNVHYHREKLIREADAARLAEQVSSPKPNEPKPNLRPQWRRVVAAA